MALNYPIQGSSAEITKLACIFIFNYLLANDLIGTVKFVNVIHDKQNCCV
jgi:DNA polymerase I-like protein with 3'-5' exonuclease and polymerase domains